jgi:peptidoglycan/LPS O-acetylase OafA/YrhL
MGKLRVLLALCVVAGHLGWWRPLDGAYAVKIFFLVSGFYMALVLTEKYPATTAGSKLFYLSRCFRIYPTYWLCASVSVLAVILTHASSGFYGNLVYEYKDAGPGLLALLIAVQFLIVGSELPLYMARQGKGFAWTANFSTTLESQQVWGMAVNPPAWSLSLELLFYAFAPKLTRLSNRWVVGLIIASLVGRLLASKFLPVDHDPWSYRFFPFEIGTFLLGVLSYRLYNQFGEELKFENLFTRSLPYGGILLLAICSKLPGGFIYVPILACPVVALIFAESRSDKFDRSLGEISYPLYLLHWPIIQITACYMHHFTALSAVIASLLLSWLVTKYIDTPVDAYRAFRFRVSNPQDA